MLLFRKRPVMPSPAEALPGRPTPLPTSEAHFVNGNPLKGPYPPGTETVVLGLGCFWGAERRFWQLPAGVFVTAVGYAGGFTPNPTYEEVCSARTGHTEIVKVVFDPTRTSWFFVLRLPPWEARRIVMADEGQGWMLIPPERFLSLPKAVPSLQDRLRVWLDGLGERDDAA